MNPLSHGLPPPVLLAGNAPWWWWWQHGGLWSFLCFGPWSRTFGHAADYAQYTDKGHKSKWKYYICHESRRWRKRWWSWDITICQMCISLMECHLSIVGFAPLFSNLLSTLSTCTLFYKLSPHYSLIGFSHRYGWQCCTLNYMFLSLNYWTHFQDYFIQEHTLCLQQQDNLETHDNKLKIKWTVLHSKDQTLGFWVDYQY